MTPPSMKLNNNQDLIFAFKTILTVVLSFLACSSFLHDPISIYFALYTAVCCALMQAGSHRQEHFKSMLLAGLAFVVFISLGLLFKNIPWLKNLSLIGFAFLAFYLPNLGFTYRMPPIFGVIFYVCVLNMATPTDPPLLVILANALASGIAIIVYFLFWPYRPEHELTLLCCNLISQYRSSIESLRQALSSTSTKQRRSELAHALQYNKHSGNSLNQFNTVLGQPALEAEDKTYFSAQYLHFYATFHIMKLMCSLLSENIYPAFLPLLQDLDSMLSELGLEFNARLPHSLLGRLIPKITPRSTPHLNVPEFETQLQNLIDEALIDGPEGQFAFALLRMKEIYNNMRTELDHWQLKRQAGLFL